MPISHESGAQMLRDINSRSVNVEGLDPAVVIAAMLNARRGDGLSVLDDATPGSVTKAYEAYRRLSLQNVDSMWDTAFLFSLGLELRLGPDGKTLRTFYYDNAYGDGLAAIVIDHIRCTTGDDRWRTSHLIHYASPASTASILLALAIIVALLGLMLLL